MQINYCARLHFFVYLFVYLFFLPSKNILFNLVAKFEIKKKFLFQIGGTGIKTFVLF